MHPHEEPEAADRTGWVWVLLFGATLAAPALVAAVDGTGAARVAAPLTALAFAAWAAAVLTPRPPCWLDRRRVLLFWAGAAVFAAVLTGLHPLFTLTLYGLIPLMFGTLGWWGLATVVAFTALVGWTSGAWDDGAAAVLNLAVVAALALAIAVVIDAVERQSARRRDALAELHATRLELAEASRRAGVLAERERLAREIHDTLAQALTSVVTHLEAAEQALDARPDSTRRHLDIARRSARDGLVEVRRTVAALRPDVLEGRTLQQALEQRAERWSAATGVLATVRASGDAVPLHPEAETALLRTAEEALANVARHARASRVVLTLSYLDDTVVLDVDDDGVGFAAVPPPRPDGGFGLPGLRERLTELGGRLDVESTPGEGTTIAAQVPA